MLNRKSLFFAGVLTAATLLSTAQAFAHAELVSSDPVADATVSAPETITLTFSEELLPAFSGFEMAMVEHNMSVPIETIVSEDGKSLVGTPHGSLMKGAYKITWQVASDDGHRETGEVNFTVE